MSEQLGNDFEIGLVCSGTVSAGAYTAGFVSFLLYALEAFETAREELPFHRPRISVISGTSGGAITSAITAIALSSDRSWLKQTSTSPLEQLASPENPFYRAWVSDIDVKSLLDTKRQETANGPLSVLNSSVLDDIRERVVELRTGSTAGPAYVRDPLPILLTVTDLRGTLYRIPLENHGREREIRNHAAIIGFRLSWNDREIPRWDSYFFPLNPEPPRREGSDVPEDSEQDNWHKLADAALASGAFPGAFKPRRLRIPLTKRGLFRLAVEGAEDFPDPAESDASLGDDVEEMICVDGGVLLNRPFRAAHAVLSKIHMEKSFGGLVWERDFKIRRESIPQEKVGATSIIIEPFFFEEKVSSSSSEESSGFSDHLLNAVFNTGRCAINQSRFTPLEASRIADPDDGSVSLIVPRRFQDGQELCENVLAAQRLRGFGGFLHETFRRYDFVLGLHNCQAFLKNHFLLPETNPIFSVWSGNSRQEVEKEDEYNDGQLPIIPLMGQARSEVKLEPWPIGRTLDQYHIKEIEKLVARRVDFVVRQTIQGSLNQNPVVRRVLGAGWSVGSPIGLKRFITKKVMEQLHKEFPHTKKQRRISIRSLFPSL